MPKSKYNRAEIKLEYFQSEIDDVATFLSKFWVKQVWWSYNKKVSGWRKEKEQYKQKIVEKALKKTLEKKARELEIPIEVLQKWKKNALIHIMNDLTKNGAKMKMRDRVAGLNALKTELWEPTSVNKNENINKSEPLDVNDFIRD